MQVGVNESNNVVYVYKLSGAPSKKRSVTNVQVKHVPYLPSLSVGALLTQEVVYGLSCVGEGVGADGGVRPNW